MTTNTQPVAGEHTPPATYSEWRQRVGGFTGLPAFLRALDVDPAAVLASVGLANDALVVPDSCIDYGALGRLLEACSERAAYPHLGLTAGRMWHLEDLGTLGDLLRNSATVGEALQALVLYQHAHSEGGLTFAAKHGSLVEVGYAIYYPGIAGADQIYDFALAWMFNLLRELVGTAWQPSQVLVPHSKPRDAVHYRNAFKVVPQFDSEVCAIRFPAVLLDQPVAGADRERRRQAFAVMHEQDGPDLLQQVFRALRDLLLNGRSSGNEVASALSMHRRTLNRRLEQCGTTFQCVLDEVRCEVARQLLCYSEVTLDDIAASLGYAGVSPFMRSFRRWTGLSPGQLRRMAVKGRDDVRPASVHANHDDLIDAPDHASAMSRRVDAGRALESGKRVGDSPARYRYSTPASTLPAHGAPQARWQANRQPAPTRSSAVAARSLYWVPQRRVPLATG